jgi:hypothetical protein
VKVLFLPDEFAELLHLGSKRSFAPYAETRREGTTLVVRIQLDDFTEDDVLLGITKNMLVILGNRYPASFCINLPIPPDAIASEMESSLEDGVLELRIPLRASS